MPSPGYITIKGFKSIRALERLEIRPVNILIGANGSGKSNLIEAFSFLRALGDGRLQHYVAQAGGAERILHRGSRHTRLIEITAELDNGQSSWRCRLIATPQDTLFKEPVGLADATPGEDQIRTSVRSQRPFSTPDSSDFRNQLLDGLRVYPPFDTGLRAPAKL